VPLHPQIVDRLHLLEGVDFTAGAEQEALDRLQAFTADDGTWALPDGITVTDRIIPGDHGEIPIRIYRPEATHTGFLLWAHGGGFAAGELDWPESHVVSAELAVRAGVTVVAVDYRLASPATRYPVPLDDVVSAWHWTRELAADRAGVGASVSIGGASAGAALALACSLRCPGTAAALLLAYPFAHFPVPALDDATAAVMRELPAQLRFTPADVEGMVAGYVGRIHDVPALALPGNAPLGSAQAPVSILTAEYDDLRPSGELLARQFADAGVPVSARLEAGVLHGHLNRHPGAPGFDDSIDWFAEALRRNMVGAA
jgi:acetyl esterase